MEQNYLAITIGPIYKTLLKSHRTREIWMASYLFSVVMEKIREAANNKGEIILPSDASKNQKTGAGIYPDRLIMTLSSADIDVQKDIIDTALVKVSAVLAISLANLKNYLQIHYLKINETDLQSFEYKDTDENNITSFVFRINYLLDHLELNATYQNSTETFFNDFFDHNTRRKFIEEAFGKSRLDFPSVLEISAKNKLPKDTLELLYQDELTEVEAKKVNETIIQLSKVHKYMAILRGDGDNFGKVIGQLSKEGVKEVKAFSKKLTDYSEKIAEKIIEYGGTVIYIGGDDVLCFAPVENNGQTIFSLIQELNEYFHQTFTDKIYTENKVSMSYGMSICYWKYPLNEALDLSYRLLNYRAKKYKPKNCLAFQILLHSGQYREVLLPFGQENAYEDLMEMLSNFSENDQFLQSLTHMFVEDKEMLEAIFKSPNYVERLNGYFENHFDPDDPRKPATASKFINAVKQLTIDTHKQMTAIHTDIDNAIAETLNQVNTICRTLKFLIPQKDDE